jgi:hypothetical protein
MTFPHGTRAFGPKALGKIMSEVDAATPAMATVAQACAIKPQTGQGLAMTGSQSRAPGKVVHLTQLGEESGNEEEDFTVHPEETLAEELPHDMSRALGRPWLCRE